MAERYKDRSYGNRGVPLEKTIELANDLYRYKKMAFIHKLATEFKPIRDRGGKIVSCKVEGKASFDFLGRYKYHPIAIEAKNTNTNSIRFDAVQENQADDMDTFTSEPGTIGLVVVSFSLERFFVIPWTFWKAAYDARVRPGGSRTSPVTVSAFGTTWDIPKKNSVRIDEIPPEFEIPSHDFTFGLHYLEKADKYITPIATTKS